MAEQTASSLYSRDHSVKKYLDLKFEYFGLLRTRKVNKGDLRAFVGFKTWFHEKHRLEAGEDKSSAHVSAFEEAIVDVKRAIEKDSFQEEFDRGRAEWLRRGMLLARVPGGPPLLPPPIPKMSAWNGNGLKLVSLFSGALGLDLGFLAAGFDLRVANDIDVNSFNTLTKNIPSVAFIHRDFTKVSTEEVLERAGLGVGEVDVLTGGPPCQPFSTAGKRQGLNDPRASPLKAFVKTISEVKPRAFVMEEVTGLMSARLQHVPISEREDRILKPEEEGGSVFSLVLEMLQSTGYRLAYGVLNAADFGSPQSRERLVFMGLRHGVPELPQTTHSSDLQTTLTGRTLEPWNTFWEATADLQGTEDNSVGLSASRAKYMRFIPPGGYWKHLPNDVVVEAMGGAYTSGGGKMGYFRRLSWDEPSPTVVGSPLHKGTLFCHPEAQRPLSVEEYKRIQGFPDDWDIVGNTQIKYRMIGDAVPVHLSYAIARKVAQLLRCENV